MRATLEPAATMALSKVMIFSPSAVCTTRLLGEANFAAPCTTCTLRCFASAARPPVSLPITLSFQLRISSMSIFGLRERHAVMRDFFRFVDDLGDMQQRLGRDAADVQAHAAQAGVLFDQHHLLAQVGSAEGGGVAAGAGAEHDDFGVDIAFGEGLRSRDCGLSRGGCSGCR